MSTERCLWKSPGNGLPSISVVEASQKFEQKYGLNIFSDEVEKSESTVVRPSDLDFSPQVKQFFNGEDLAKHQSPLLSSKSASNKTNTPGNVIQPTSVEKVNSVPSSTFNNDMTPSTTSSVLITTKTNTPSYFNYTGVSFGQKQNDLSPSSKANSKVNAISYFNPWILSNGIPNFARNTPSETSMIELTQLNENKKRTREETVVLEVQSGSITSSVDVNGLLSSDAYQSPNKRVAILDCTTSTGETVIDSSSNNSTINGELVGDTSDVATVAQTLVQTSTVQETTTEFQPLSVDLTVEQPTAVELSPEQQLLKEIKEERQCAKEFEARIVNAIAGENV